jgi:hypothetical protein
MLTLIVMKFSPFPLLHLSLKPNILPVFVIPSFNGRSFQPSKLEVTVNSKPHAMHNSHLPGGHNAGSNFPRIASLLRHCYCYHGNRRQVTELLRDYSDSVTCPSRFGDS